MGRRKIRGGSFLMRNLVRRGVLDFCVEYKVGGTAFRVPLAHLPWDFTDLISYEKKLIDSFCCAINQLDDVTLFDCGADIGTFSALVCARTRQISRIIAYEPNRDVQEVLRENLRSLSTATEVFSKAVGSFCGTGRLDQPDYDDTDHARFLVPGSGAIEVTTVDNRNVRGGDVAIKLDVEGGELEALKGAANTIVSARQCVVAVEANPVVAKRTQRDPVECLRFLSSLRPFQFVVAETGDRPSLGTALLRSQQAEVWNVIAATS
jgi:FkbM family methyltransferase